LDYPACFIADFLTGRSAVRTHKLGLILGVVLLAASAWAGDGGSPAEAVVTHRGLHIPRLKQTPTLADFLSMQPSERMQGKMVRVNSFIQRDPSEGRPATQKTDVYLGYDQSKLYAVFICFDGSPDLVRSHLAPREDVFSDDIVELMLDTFHDERRGYAFIVNPLGIQWDATWNESSGFDSSWDAVWSSDGKRTDHGYVTLMSIPFKSLRFAPEDVQTWGIMLNRYIPHLNEDAYWPQLSRNISGRLNQASEATGLEHISPGRNMQFVPYFMTRRGMGLNDPGSGTASFQAQNETTMGLDSKIVLKDSLVLDATLKPDFSQVESDSPQVTVNQRYEIFYPEKRPFFLENASYFDTPFDLVFTRRIAAPDYGVRLSGKVGDYAVGALFADDRSAGELLDPIDPAASHKAYFTVLRASRDLLDQSNLGLIYTDRQFAGEHNQVGGIDGKFKLADHWSSYFQAVTSSTRDADGAYAAGPAYQFGISRGSRHLNFGSSYYDVGTDFQTDLGYVRRPDVRNTDSWLSYRFRPEGSSIISWGPSFGYDENWDHSGMLLDRTYSSSVSWSMKQQTAFGLSYRNGVEQLRPIDFDTLDSPRLYDEYNTGFWSSFGVTDAVTFGGGYNWNERINYVPAAGAPEPASGENGNVWVTLRPKGNVRIDNSYILDRVQEPDSGLNVYNNHIVRSKVNYQFNRELSLRVIAQYNAVLANPTVSSLQNTKAFNTDLLVSYLVHPGTAVYLGYNSDLQNLDPALARDPAGNLLRNRNGFLNDGRQIFIKVSYLFRR
jgi:hypothetical protein